ncbi:MAG: hypothetical protein E3K37_05460 [Candidatus Kuenenia sp.]|nr:hypothetical protein [Candidatus Kuenenia hertensis]
MKRKAVFTISFGDEDRIPLQMKNKLSKQLEKEGTDKRPVDIGWNFGMTNAVDLQTTKYITKITYQIEGNDLENLESEAKKIYEQLEMTLAAHDQDLKIQNYKILD